MYTYILFYTSIMIPYHWIRQWNNTYECRSLSAEYLLISPPLWGMIRINSIIIGHDSGLSDRWGLKDENTIWMLKGNNIASKLTFLLTNNPCIKFVWTLRIRSFWWTISHEVLEFFYLPANLSNVCNKSFKHVYFPFDKNMLDNE